LTEKHLKTGKETKLVKKAQDLRIKDLDEALSQCKQVQEERLEEQSQKTEANALKLNRAVTSLQDTLYHPHEVTLPTFIYSYKTNTDQLHRTSLATGEHSSNQVPSYTFKFGWCWSEVPEGSLHITGGVDEALNAVR
jgi:outer membrane phospholipase A